MKWQLLCVCIFVLNFVGLGLASQNATLFDLLQEQIRRTRKHDKHTPNFMQVKRLALGIDKCRSVKNYNFMCNRQCHFPVPLSSLTGSYCRNVSPNSLSYCFGHEIVYNHTVDMIAEKEYDRFRIIQQFPRCWSKIAPLICASVYRPCQQTLYHRIGGGDETYVAHQVFASKFCDDAQRECAFLLESGLWPKFIDCTQRVDPENIDPAMNNVQILYNRTKKTLPEKFSDHCTTSYNSSLKFKNSQCIWPLVSSSLSTDSRPVVDGCFLPCRSSFFEDETKLNKFRYWNFWIAFIPAIIFLSAAIYLWLLSQYYLERYEVFILTHTFVSISVYYLMWAILSVDIVADLGVCTANGTIRRGLPRISLSDIASLRALLSVCAVEAFAFLFLPLCAYIWLTAFLVYRCCGSQFCCADLALSWGLRGDNIISQAGAMMSARRALLIGVYSFGVLWALFAVVALQVPVDGLMRKCHFGAFSSDSYNQLYMVYTPIIVMNVILTCVAVRYVAKGFIRRRQNISEASSNLGQCANNEDPLLDASGKHLDLTRRNTLHKNMKVFSKLRYSYMYLNKSAGAEFCETLSENDSSSNSLIDIRFFWTIFISNLIFCCMGVFALLFSTTIIDKNERSLILKSANCSLNWRMTVENVSSSTLDSWMSDTGLANFDPYKRLLASTIVLPERCNLQKIECLEEAYLLAQTLIFPALLFFIVLSCFLYSLKSDKGFWYIRSKLFSCPNVSKETDSNSPAGSTAEVELRSKLSTSCQETQQQLTSSQTFDKNSSFHHLLPCGTYPLVQKQPLSSTVISNTVGSFPHFYNNSLVDAAVPQYYNQQQTLIPPFVNQHYWNSYDGSLDYLSASTNDLPTGTESEAYDCASKCITPSMSNSDPIYKSNERKKDMNRHYRTHLIHKSLIDKHQAKTQQDEQIHNKKHSANFLAHSSLVQFGNSDTTLNMTSVSQQPTVVPNVPPVVVNALNECYKQGVEYGEQQMKDRMDELTNIINQYSIGFKQLQRLFGYQDDEFMNPVAESKIPMIFGADGQRIMREFHLRNNAKFDSVSCEDHILQKKTVRSSKELGNEMYSENGHRAVKRTCSDSDNIDIDGVFGNDISHKFKNYDNIINDKMGSKQQIKYEEQHDETTSVEDEQCDGFCNGETTELNDRLSDEFNSDSTDSEEEKLHSMQMEKLHKEKMLKEKVLPKNDAFEPNFALSVISRGI